jgi:hypothetical protein
MKIPAGIVKGVEWHYNKGGYQEQLAKAWGWMFNYIVEHSEIPEIMFRKWWKKSRTEIIQNGFCWEDYDDDENYLGNKIPIPVFNDVYINNKFILDYNNLKFHDADEFMYKLVLKAIKNIGQEHESALIANFFASLNDK